jgi:tight adherence protein B
MTTSGVVAASAVALAALLAMGPSARPVDRLPVVAARRPGDSSSRSGRRRGVALAVLGSAVALTLSPMATITALSTVAAVGVVVVVGGARRRERRLAAARSAAVVDLTYGLAAEMRAGRPPAAALDAMASGAGPLADPLRQAATVAATGVPVADELRRIADLPGAGALAAVAAVWEVTERHGGPVADVLDRLGEALDAEAAASRALQAALAGPRATMGLLLVLPALGVALGESVGAGTVSFLAHQPLGWGLLGAATALDLAGVAWTRRLLVGAARP